MAFATTKEITAKLKLDGKGFKKGLSDTHKDIMKVTAAITAVGAAAVAVAKMTANYRDETIKAARAAGSTAEEFSGLRHAANLSGVSFDQLTKNLQKMMVPTGEAKKAFDRLGLSIKDNTGKSKTQRQLLSEIADKFKDMKSPAEKAATAYQIFGARGASMVNMLKDGSSGLKEMTDEAVRMGLVFDEKSGEAAEKFNDDITRLTGSIKGFAMSIGGSIIDVINQSGAFEIVSKTIQAATGWWNSLDDSTKNAIMTIGAVVAGIGALALAFAALAPMIGSAITVMTGGLNLVVVAIAAAIIAFTAMAAAAIKYWDQIKSAAQPAIDSISEAIDMFLEAISPITGAISGLVDSISDKLSSIKEAFYDWMGITDESAGKISVLGTVVKAVFGTIGTIIIVATTPFKVLYHTISGIIEAVQELGKNFKNYLMGDIEGAAQNSVNAMQKIRDMQKKVSDDLDNAGKRIKDTFSNIVVTIDPNEAKRSIQSVNDLLDMTTDKAQKSASEIDKAFGLTDATFQRINKELQSFTGKFSTIIQPVSTALEAMTTAIETGISNSLATLTRRFDFFSAKYTEALDNQIKATEEAENEKIRTLEEKYNEQIMSLENAEAAKTLKIEAAAAKRLLALDEEYQAQAEAQENAFEVWQENELIKFEAEKELLLEKAIDKEQRNITETIMDADFKAYMENQQALHNQKMDQLALNYTAKQKEIDAKSKADLAASEELHKATIEGLTDEKNTAIEEATAKKDAKLSSLEEQRYQDEKKMKKMEIYMTWRAEKANVEQTKAMKIAMTTITGIANAAMAFAQAFGQLGFPAGPIVGAVMMAAVLATTFASVAQIATQTVPPPVSLFLQSGGVTKGPSHAQGGIPAELEGGEGILDTQRTRDFITAADNYIKGANKDISINFLPGSIVNNGNPMDDQFLDAISYKIAQRIEGLI